MSIDEGVRKYLENKENAVLIDVRGTEEFAAGHIPGSINIPLNTVANADIPKGKILFVYCKSGKRSARACNFLTAQGYETINIGGIDDYTGEKA